MKDRKIEGRQEKKMKESKKKSESIQRAGGESGKRAF